MKLSIFNRHPHAELSAYVDGELIPLRIEALQAHLASCRSCGTELEALRELKAGLATLPEMAAPRSFALTSEIIARPLREPAVVPARARALANGMRLAGAGMTLALVLVLVLDFTGGGTKGGNAPGAGNVQQIAAAPSSDSLSSAGGNVTAPTPAPTHNDLSSVPPAISTGTPFPEGLSSGGGPIAGIPATPGIAPAPIVGGPSPAVVPTDGSPPADKSAVGTKEASASNAPAAFNVQPSVFDTQQPAAASTGSGGGADVLLLVALALAVGIALTVAASFILPRLGREDV